jgi:hypothetical protein
MTYLTAVVIFIIILIIISGLLWGPTYIYRESPRTAAAQSPFTVWPHDRRALSASAMLKYTTRA